MSNDKEYLPPKILLYFFKWFCRRDLHAYIEGDLLELYAETRENSTKRKANIKFALDILQLFRPNMIKSFAGLNRLNYFGMIKNYFKVTWRNVIKHKMYAAIKIGGFSLGIAACFLISLFIKDELSYDKNYKNVDRIYRMLTVNSDPSDLTTWPSFQAPIAEVLRNDFPEIEKVGRLIPYDWFDAGNNQVKKSGEEKNSYEEGFAYADGEVLEILEIPMVYGDRSAALSQPNTLVISKRKSEKYFPNENPIGKTIFLNNDESRPFAIGGVMENFPRTSHLQFDFFITLKGKEFWPGEQSNWCCSNYNVYLLPHPDTNPDELSEKLIAIRDNYQIPHFRRQGSMAADIMEEYRSFRLQLVSDIHLESADIYDVFANGDIKLVWLFGSIAAFVLLLACINFINLSTAKSANRAKEVGIRKVMGSVRGHLVNQFLIESIFFSSISVVLGSFLTYVLLPYFNALSGKSLSFPIQEWYLIPLLVGFAVIVGILAGLYPSFYLSGFKPIEVLKGNIQHGAKSSKLRNIMVVFQFTTSMILIVSALVIYRQMDFILNKKIGFDKEHVVMLWGANTLEEKMTPFKNELVKKIDIQSVTTSNYLPVSGTSRDQNEFWKHGRSQIDIGVGAQVWGVDEDYLNTLGIKLTDGRNFNTAMASDTAAIIINKTMVKDLGLENPVGARIINWKPWIVIGVIEDFHFESIKGGIGPLALIYTNRGSIASVKIQTKDMSATLESITTTWDQFMPNQPIRYTFLDDSYARMYDDVKRMGNVFAVFAVLAVIVACLGLFGLSAFLTEQRSKEISIRKVLGASLRTIFTMLTFNFLKMIIISLAIGMPIAWYFMDSWLADYENRVDLGWDLFAISSGLVIVIALCTVSFESIKASIVNPVEGLRAD